MNAKIRTIMILGAVFGVAAIGRAQIPLDRPLAYFDKLVSQLKISTVVGEPIRVGETTVIPFARVSFGFGAGGAMMGLGGGMGGKTVPLGVLIVEGDDARAELFPQEEKGPSFVEELKKLMPEKLIIGNGINIAGSPGVFEEMVPKLSEMLKGTTIMGNGINVAGSKATATSASATAGTGAAPAAKTGAAAGKAATASQGTKAAQPAPAAKPATIAEMQKLYTDKKYPEALAMADNLLAIDPDDANLHAWKGHIMGTMAQGNPMDMIKYGMGAMQEYEKALAIDPNNAEGHFGRGVGRLSAPPGFGGDIDGAITDLEAAVSKKPSPKAYFYLGEAYRRKMLNDKAKEAYTQALKMQPDYPEAKKALEGLK